MTFKTRTRDGDAQKMTKYEFELSGATSIVCSNSVFFFHSTLAWEREKCNRRINGYLSFSIKTSVVAYRRTLKIWNDTNPIESQE